MAGTLQDLLNEEIAIFLFFGAKQKKNQKKAGKKKIFLNGNSFKNDK